MPYGSGLGQLPFGGADVTDTISPTGIASAEAFGGHTVIAPVTQTLLPAGFDASGAMGIPTIDYAGAYTIFPVGIP